MRSARGIYKTNLHTCTRFCNFESVSYARARIKNKTIERKDNLTERINAIRIRAPLPILI